MKSNYGLDRLMRNDTLGCTLLACLLVGVFGGALLV
jgi:hypothetical protein